MVIKLVVKEGPRAGEEFSIRGDVVIGRSRAELSIKDSKSSGEHAKIVLNDEQKFEIHDLGSSNGTFLNDKPIDKAPLKVGDKILIGKTLMEVAEISGESQFERGSWQARVDEDLEERKGHFEKLPTLKTGYGVFKDVVCLEISKGVDAGEKFFYAFGPRTVGLHSLDCSVLDSKFPPEAFQLMPVGENCQLTALAENILVNQKAVTDTLLKQGDVISVGQTEFVVKFVDPS